MQLFVQQDSQRLEVSTVSFYDCATADLSRSRCRSVVRTYMQFVFYDNIVSCVVFLLYGCRILPITPIVYGIFDQILAKAVSIDTIPGQLVGRLDGPRYRFPPTTDHWSW
jgi:hypothetical protein